MIAICTDPTGTQIFGTAGELRQVQQGILRLAESDSSIVSYDATSTNRASSTPTAGQLLIRRASGRTLVSLDGTNVVVQGSSDSLAKFASWFEFPASAESGDHSHFEPMPGDHFHSPESVPLVISVSDAGV
jgi:hypothetical protein